MILVHSSPATLEREGHDKQLVGVLSSPRRFYPEAAQRGFTWAADNDCFSEWHPERYRKMLHAITGLPGCLFVVAPDVVGDPSATLARFREWLAPVRATGQPVAFVAQDQDADEWVPWGEFDVLFIGGSTAFKIGPVAAAMVRRARLHGLWVHMGRVNSKRRMRYAASIGCHSVDGTNFSRFRAVAMPWAREVARHPQLRLAE